VRIANRLIASVLAVLAAVAGVLVAIEVFVAQVLKREPWIIPYDDWLQSARKDTWADSNTVLQIGLGLVLAGVLVVGLQLLRRRPTGLPVEIGHDFEVWVQRRSLERSLTRRAERVDAVQAARVKLRRDKLRVYVDTHRRQAPDLEGDVTRAVTGAVEHLHPVRTPAIDVAVSRRVRS